MNITPKQAYCGLIKLDPRYHDRLVELAECVVLLGATKQELMDKFYTTDGGKDLLATLRS